MADTQAVTCDFCNAPFEWTPSEVGLDLALRVMGSGLGACCTDCDDKQIAIFQRQMAEEDAQREEDERGA